MLFPVLLCCMPACTYWTLASSLSAMSNLRWILSAKICYCLPKAKAHHAASASCHLRPAVRVLSLLQHCYHLLFSYLPSERSKYPWILLPLPFSFAPFSGSLVHDLQDFLSLLLKCQLCSCIYAQVEHQPDIPSRMHLLSILEKCSPSAKLIRCIQKAINHQLADKHYLLLKQLPQKVTASSLGRHKISHLSHILVILTNLHYSNDCTQTTCFRASSICLLNPGRDYLPQ